MRILVVEDEVYVADLICTILEEMGISCLLARDAAEADRVLGRSTVDGMTLDLGLPGTHGLDWLDALADTNPTLARNTLVITGMPMEHRAAERVARHGAGVLAKPFTVDALQEAFVAHVLKDAVIDPAD
jgi:DNA-binding response OmpR family regulator